MKMKVLLALLIIAVCTSLLGFAACAPEEAPPAPTPTPKPTPTPTPKPPVEKPFEWPSMLKIATPSATGAYYQATIAWTPINERATGVKWRVVPESVSATCGRWLKGGEADFWLTNMDTPAFAVEAIESYATREGGPIPIRVVWQNDILWMNPGVRGDSDIQTLADIKPGTTWGNWEASPTFVKFYEAMRAWLDMTPEELVVVPFGSVPAFYTALGDGKVDVAYVNNTSSVVYEIAAGPQGLRYLGLPEEDLEGQKRFRQVFPTAIFGKVDWGVEAAHGVNGQLLSFCYYTLDDMDTELVYNMAKWLHQNFDDYKDMHESCSRMSIDWFRKTLDDTFLPIHEGTIKYMKEAGMWTAADDVRQEYNVRLVDKYIEAYETAIGMADEGDIKIDPANEEWMELWSNYKKEIGIPPFKVLSDKEIADALEQLK